MSRFCLDDSFRTAQPFVTKLGTVVHNYEPGYHAKEIFKVTTTGKVNNINI